MQRTLALLALTLWAVAALAQSPVAGTLTVAGKPTPLTQVYAWRTEGFFDKKKDDTVVLLADRSVAAADQRDEFALRRLAAEGKLCFVRETINADGQIINFTIGHRAFRVPPSGGSTEHVFEGRHEGQTISGKVRTRGVQESFDDIKYEYVATFHATVQPKK
jgi:hypothetical protein